MATEAWVTIDTDALRDYFVSAGVDAAQTAALGDGQGDPTESIINDVTRRIRSEIGTRWTLSATENSIPQDLRWVACLLCAEQMCTRVPGLVNLLDGSQALLRDARAYLLRVAQGEVSIPMPEDPMEPTILQQNRAPVVVTSVTRKFTRDSLAAL